MRAIGIGALSFLLVTVASEPSYKGAWFYLALTLLALVMGVQYLGCRQGGGAAGDLSRREGLWCLAVALALGAALRVSGIDFGLPHAYHPDEFRKINALAKMLGQGNLDPHNYFLHPPLLLYCSYFMAKAIALFSDMPPRATETLLLAGRTVSCIAGVATIGMTYLLGSEVWNRRSGAIAALLLAVLPLHVTCSRYMKEDVLMTLFLVGSTWCLARFERTNRFRDLFAAAVFVGVSIASKYTGLVALAPLGAVTLLHSIRGERSDRLRILLAGAGAVGISIIVFFILAPYSWWRLDRFLAGFAAESTHAASGHHGVLIRPWPNLWMFHLSRSLLPGMGALPLFTAVAAAGAVLVRRRPLELLLLVTAGLFYGVAELSPTKPFPQPERYVIPCLPYLVLLTSLAVAALATRRAQLLAMGVLLVWPLARTVQLASEIRPDTRQLTRIWMTEHLPRGSKVLTTGGAVYLPRFPPGILKITSHGKVLPKKAPFIAALRASGYSYLLVARFDSPYLREVRDEKDLQREAAGLAPPIDKVAALRETFPVVFEARARSGSYGFHNPVLTLFDLRAKEEME